MIYLACPYSYPSPTVRADRVEFASMVAADLMARAEVVFSPITHGHAVARHLPSGITNSRGFWMRQCLPVLRRCGALYILPLEGWAHSRGVKAEIEFAEHALIPVRLLEPRALVLDSHELFDLPSPTYIAERGWHHVTI